MDRYNEKLRNTASGDANFVAETTEKSLPDTGGLVADIDHIVGANIKRERIKAGLTQVELGARIGVSGSMISQYESTAAYARRPRWETLERIAQALGISSMRLIAVPPEPSFWTDKFRHGLSAVLEGIDLADAEESGLDIEYAEAIASGGAGFTFEDACQLCNTIGCSPNELLDWEKNRTACQDEGES